MGVKPGLSREKIQGAEENIWTSEGGSGGRLKKTA
jgi:hypothetical protein